MIRNNSQIVCSVDETRWSPRNVDLSEMAIGVEEELAGGSEHRENDATGGDERKVRDVKLSDGNTARRLAVLSPSTWC